MQKSENSNLMQFVAVKALALSLALLLGFSAMAQTKVSLDNLDFFKDPGKSWSIAGDVFADLNEKDVLTASKGQGILANIPTKKNKGIDLYSHSEYGDMDLELEYMVAKGSNSGIYLQGRYEIQILDSWGKKNPRSGDNGGIYERWDESKPDGQKGYQGYAPRQNTSKAPGLWQTLKVSFQAPRFDGNGNKTENAKMLRVELNGTLIHENVELFGPTRGAMSDQEVAKGPLRIQGDHGAAAFRNITIHSFDKPKPELTDLQYVLYEGRFEEVPDFTELAPQTEGSTDVLTSNIRSKSRQFLLRYTGKLNVNESGDYVLHLNVPGGGGMLKIDGEEALGIGQNQRRGTVNLSAGEHSFELLYAKFMDWVEPGLGLAIAGPGLRQTQLSNSNTSRGNAVDPILVDPKEKPVLRSFMDLPDGPRVTHAISVGSENNVHYTYDLDHGNIIQVWRGGFLDATPMWHSRGDGSSRPMGSVLYFGEPALTVARLASGNDNWVTDTAQTAYQPKGYRINSKENHLAYKYRIYGATVEDDIEILDNGYGIKRKMNIRDLTDGMYVRLAQGASIKEMAQGWYLIDDKAYYLNLEGDPGVKPILRKVAGKDELIVPATASLIYTILF